MRTSAPNFQACAPRLQLTGDAEAAAALDLAGGPDVGGGDPPVVQEAVAGQTADGRVDVGGLEPARLQLVGQFPGGVIAPAEQDEPGRARVALRRGRGRAGRRRAPTHVRTRSARCPTGRTCRPRPPRCRA